MKQGWEIKKLGEVCQVSAGQGAPQGEDKYGTIGKPFIKAGNLEGLLSGVDESEIQHVNEVVAKQHRLKLYPRGSVLFAKSGMSCMKGHVYALKTDSYVVSHLAVLTPTGISTQFLTYLLNYYRPNTLVKDSSYPSISLEDIKVFTVPVPPIAEQEKIVAELDCLSGIIEKKKQQLKELDNLAQSIFHEMFGDPVENDKGWEIKRLGDISQSQIGITYKPENVSDDNGTIVLRSGNIQESALCFNDIVRVNCDIKEHKYVQKGDILMCSRNGSHRLVGKVAMIPELSEKMTYGAFMTIIRSDFQSYLFAFFRTPAFRSQLTSAQTATINQITVKMLNEIIVALPPLTLQQDFASKIESIEKQKELIAQSIKETETLFNSRMDYYFG